MTLTVAKLDAVHASLEIKLIIKIRKNTNTFSNIP